MRTNAGVGRIVGVLLLLQLVGLAIGFSITMPALTADYLSLAAPMAGTVRAGAIVLLLNAAVGLAIAVVAYRVIREYGPGWAIWLVAMAVAWFVLQATDNAHILSMLTLSRRYAESASANPDLLNIVAAQARSTRGFIHYSVLLVIDIWFVIFYGALTLFRLVPRVVGIVGLAATALHMIGVSLSAFVGYGVVWALAYPFMLAYLLGGAWLIAKGFPERKS